jgi:hypothetical protein
MTDVERVAIPVSDWDAEKSIQDLRLAAHLALVKWHLEKLLNERLARTPIQPPGQTGA